MTIFQMRYFLAVCRHGNVTKAAQSMNIAQPSVSASIRELEREFGVNLFHRIKKQLILTEEGHFFQEKMEPILDQIDVLTAQMQDFGRGHNQIRIGIPPMIGTFLFPRIFLSFHETYPEIEIVMVEHGSLTVKELVLNDQLDIAIAIINPKIDVAFETIHLLRVTLLFCIALSHHMAAIEEISLEDLRGEPIILLGDGSFQYAELTKRFLDKQIKPSIQLASSQIYVIKKMISHGKAGAFLFKEIVEMEPEIIGIPLKEPIELDICLIWKKDRHIFSDTAKLIKFVTSELSQGQQGQRFMHK